MKRRFKKVDTLLEVSGSRQSRAAEAICPTSAFLSSYTCNLSLSYQAQEDFLDGSEQKELMSNLQQIHKQQTLRTRLLLLALSLLCLAGHLYLAAQQHLHPWGLKHHAHFYGRALIGTQACIPR